MLRPRRSRNLVLGLSCTLAIAPAARAAERVQLRNGFSIDCDHREPAQAGRVRLVISPTQQMDVDAASIASVEPVATPPEPVSSAAGSRVQAGVAAPRAQNTGPQDLAGLVASAAHARNINLNLLHALIQAESGGHAHAVSRAGAQGLMQLMPATARSLGVQDSFAPADNLRGGTAYLDLLLTRYHDNLTLALAAYNAGPAAVDRYHGVPPYRETIAYVSRIVREMNRRTLAQRQSVTQGSATVAGVKLP